MEGAYRLSGGAPQLRRYQVNATVSNGILGVPMLIGTTTNAGIILATTTSAADCVGLAIDNATYTTTQGTGADSAERLVTVIINPDLVFKARINQGATEGTQLTLYDVTTANSGGTVINTGDDWNGTTFAGGAVFGYDGANVSQLRKIVSTDTTSATVAVPFDYGTVVGDNFIRSPYWEASTTAVQLTTNFYEVDNSIVVGTGGAWLVDHQEFRDLGGAGRLNSFLYMLAGDHFLNRLS